MGRGKPKLYLLQSRPGLTRGPTSSFMAVANKQVVRTHPLPLIPSLNWEGGVGLIACYVPSLACGGGLGWG